MKIEKQLCAGNYRANQVGNTVYLIAYGRHATSGYEVELEDTPIAVFPPEFRLVHIIPSGQVSEVITPFVVFKSFPAEEPIEQIIVHDSVGRQIVGVEQTPDFHLESEMQKLLGERFLRYEKLTAGLASLVRQHEIFGVNAAAVNSPRNSLTSLSVPAGGGPPQTTIFLRCDEDASFEQRPGVKVNSKRGNIRTARVSLDGLEALSRDDRVYRLSESVKLKPLNDFAATKTQLPIFRNNNSTITGKGVIIGVVDSGIDSTHPCFAGRILSIWDQEISGQGWGAKNYGKVLPPALLAASSDTNGHGTHVAGTAAGLDPQFSGVAPEAELIIVKTDFNNAHIGDGIDYIFSEAARLNKPAVVNLSLGGHINSHDGTDDLSELINSLVGAGRIVVAAAGNEGTDDIHGAADLLPGQTVRLEFTVSRNSAGNSPPAIWMSGWYDPTGNCQISVRSPSGGSTPLQPVIAAGDPTRNHTIGSMMVSLTTPPSSASINGDHEFQVILQSNLLTGQVQTGTWQLIIRNNGAASVRIDVWSAVPSGFRDAEFLAPFNNSEMKIGSPGCADEVVTVASYTTRNNWTDVNGSGRSVMMAIDDMSDFSSPGPLRNGSHKPDVAAPGAMIVSAFSSQSVFRSDSMVNQNFKVNAGTSMACPYIAGICALLLQRDALLTPSDIKQILKNNCRIPGQPHLSHDVKWGHGLIDAIGL